MQPGSFAPPPPVLPSDDYGPSKWWFLVAGLVTVGGIALAILIFVVGLMNFFDRIEGFQRVDVPGTAQVVLGTGGYSVYHEYTGASSDIGIGFVGMPAVTITSPSGDAVDLRPYTTNVTYSGSGYEGEGILTFDADEAAGRWLGPPVPELRAAGPVRPSRPVRPRLRRPGWVRAATERLPAGRAAAACRLPAG